MNILKKELKASLKAFFCWSVGLFFVVFAGMAKYTGFASDTSVAEIFDSFPKIVLAVFGMVDIDITSLGGFYAVDIYYAIICIAIYAIGLGVKVVNQESIDKTYEFIFSKPCTRYYILRMKFASAFIYITLYSVLNFIFSVGAISTLDIENTIFTSIVLYSVAMWLLGILFCTVAMFICAIIKNSEKGALYSNLVFLGAFVLGMLYDMVENGWIIRVFSPLKYFLPKEVLNDELNILFVCICVVFSIGFYIAASKLFERKDLQA